MTMPWPRRLRCESQRPGTPGTDDMRSDAFGEDWPLICATRNRIADGYAFIDRAMIAATIDRDLPGFESTIRRLHDEQP